MAESDRERGGEGEPARATHPVSTAGGLAWLVDEIRAIRDRAKALEREWRADG